MKNNIVKILFSSILFGICYALITFIFDHEIDLQSIVITTVLYYLFTNILYWFAPKLRKMLGYNHK